MFKAINPTKLFSRFNSKVPSPLVKPSALVYEAEVLSGVPDEVTNRTVIISRRAKSAMQSGTAGSDEWRIDFDSKPRWENDLMGWASSADTVQGLRLKFDSKDDAIRFATRQGYKYSVREPKETKFKVNCLV
jgi:NADH dehydrogenase (ubiquinone) Fe-S protein 4